ncbi:cytochrome P450 [Mycena olivaceomarginata]|nr:cytochrome P450 [Mycena olivaceomarginata]
MTPTSPTAVLMRTHIYLLTAALLVVCALYSAWRRHAVKCLVPLRGPAPSSFFLGNSKDLYSGPHGLAYHHALSATYGRAFKVHMMAGEEQIYLSDMRALHHVLVCDTHVFDETPAMMSEFYYCFGPGLISVHGDTHKKYISSLLPLRFHVFPPPRSRIRSERQRKMIQPLFGAAHMRALTPTFWGVACQARDVIGAKVRAACASDVGKASQQISTVSQQPSAVLDLWKWCSRAALEGVGVGALGYSFDALDDETEDNAYMVAARELPYTVYPLRKFMPICIWCMRTLPVWLQRALARLTPVPRVQKVRRIVKTLQRNSEALYAAKKVALSSGDAEVAVQVGAGKDVMSVLMKANMPAAANEKESLPDEEVLGQMNTLVSAAHDTTSSALARMLYSLAHDLPRQHRLREELAQARADTFGRARLPHAHYPPCPSSTRATARPSASMRPRPSSTAREPLLLRPAPATEAITIPLSAPIELSNGEFVCTLPIAKSQTVVVAIEAVNRDTAIWGPDADTWVPERWIEGLPPSVHVAGVPGAFSHMLTFLGGNRSCIGMKFAEIELSALPPPSLSPFRPNLSNPPSLSVETILIALVEEFEFAPAPGHEEIKWRLSLVQTPALPGREHVDEPELPLLVTMVKPAEAKRVA